MSNHFIPSYKNGGWAVKKLGSLIVSKSFNSQDGAVRYGRELNRKEKTELFIHKRDGTIQDRNT